MYIFKKSRLRLLLLYIIYSSIYIGLNVWLMVSLRLGPGLLIITILIISIILTNDLKTKVIIDGNYIYYKTLIRKKSYPIKDIAKIVKRRSVPTGIAGRHDYLYVRDKHSKDVLVFPHSLPQKKELLIFEEIINSINPSVYFDMYHKETKIYWT